MEIRKANIEDASFLSELAMRSKAYWGYDDNFIKACKDDLTVSNKNIASDFVYLLEDAGNVIGFYCLVICGDIGELNALFIEPKHIGKGYGKILYADLMQRADEIGIKEFTIDADPNAEEFYKKMGAVRIGEVDSTVFKNRRLPLMKMFV